MIYIIDLGSQYTMLIARRIRELGVYSEIVEPSVGTNLFVLQDCDGIILSGGPSSAYEEKIKLDRKIFELNKPILGICLGMQLIAHISGGKVSAGKREYGKIRLSISSESKLFTGLPPQIITWMSHGDRVIALPKGFKVIASSEEVEIAGMEKGNILGLQFHPEVVHTEMGDTILRNFVFNICRAKGDWIPESFIEKKVSEIREKILATKGSPAHNHNHMCGIGVGGSRSDGILSEEGVPAKVIVALSGGVDSAVTCKLVYSAVTDRCIPIFVDTGLMRSGEREEIEELFKNAHTVDAQDEFFSSLAGIVSPEEKRIIIGRKFIEIFEQEARKFKDVKFLAQGTLYPDRIESRSQVGPSATIKTHHNVGALPEKMGLILIEPLRDLFKDEVREVGRLLGLPTTILERHPFPGPGLAVRIIGEVTRDRVKMLQKADAIYLEEIKKASLYDKIWQAFALLLPVKSVGVMGDKRSYENVVALRAVVSVDGMTASPFQFPWAVLIGAGDRIVREVQGINRVVYDITSKPPATIEWE